MVRHAVSNATNSSLPRILPQYPALSTLFRSPRPVKCILLYNRPASFCVSHRLVLAQKNAPQAHQSGGLPPAFRPGLATLHELDQERDILRDPAGLRRRRPLEGRQRRLRARRPEISAVTAIASECGRGGAVRACHLRGKRYPCWWRSRVTQPTWPFGWWRREWCDRVSVWDSKLGFGACSTIRVRRNLALSTARAHFITDRILDTRAKHINENDRVSCRIAAATTEAIRATDKQQPQQPY